MFDRFAGLIVTSWFLGHPSRLIVTSWFLGHPLLTHIIDRVAYSALSSRIHVRCQLRPRIDREHFTQFIKQAFKEAGGESNLMTESLENECTRLLSLVIILQYASAFQKH